MKAIFIFRNTAIASLMFLSAATNAQNGADPQQVAIISPVASTLELPASAPSVSAKDEIVLGGLKLRNEKLHRNFTASFKGASDISVFPYAKSTVIYCRVDGIRNNIMYTNKGKLEHVVRYYEPGLLPKTVSNTVTEAFPDYKMLHVIEVKIDGRIAHLVSIENKEKLKVIRVAENDWDVYQEFAKQ